MTAFTEREALAAVVTVNNGIRKEEGSPGFTKEPADLFLTLLPKVCGTGRASVPRNREQVSRNAFIFMLPCDAATSTGVIPAATFRRVRAPKHLHG